MTGTLLSGAGLSLQRLLQQLDNLGIRGLGKVYVPTTDEHHPQPITPVLKIQNARCGASGVRVKQV
jgi:hypothetical protein